MTRVTGDRALTLQLRREQVLPHWCAGKTSREIGELLGLRHKTVDAYISLTGIGVDYPRIEPRQVRRLQRGQIIQRMHAEGASNAEIAIATGYKESSVKTRASELGLVYTAGKRAHLARGTYIPAMTPGQLRIFKELSSSGISAHERYAIAVRSTKI